MKASKLQQLFRLLYSTNFTLLCLCLTMVLVCAGTIAQVYMGTFAAQAHYFNSFWVYAHVGSVKIPVFPGGMLVGLLWVAALVASFIGRFDFFKGHFGLTLAHAGILVLILGQAFTQIFSEETMMSLEVGQSADYSESRTRQELVFINSASAGFDEVITVPVSRLASNRSVKIPGLPFGVFVRKLYPNAQVGQSSGERLATRGVGAGVAVQELPFSWRDEEPNSAAAFIEISDRGKSLGTWLVSAEVNAPQALPIEGQSFSIALRQKRTQLPFALTLEKFSHDVYPGTNIPKNFSSLVRVNNRISGESRDALIHMNHPLRYGGMAFYQASYGKNDTLSILQVVRNPGWLIPYISCVLVTLGLLLEFLRRYPFGARKRNG